MSDRLGRTRLTDEPRPRDGHVRRRWAGKAKAPDQPAQALKMEKSGRTKNQDKREMTEME